MGQRGRVLLGVLAGALIIYGFGTLSGVFQWPGERAAGMVSATTIEFSIPCSSLSAAAKPSSSVSGRTTVTVTAQAAGCAHPVYQFWMLAPGAANYEVVQSYSTRSSFKWAPVQVPPGTYQFAVWARDAGGGGATISTLGRFDVSSAAIPFKVNACSSVAMTVGPNSFARPDHDVSVTAHATGCSSPLYRFWVLAPGAKSYKMVQDYSATSLFVWSTTGLAAGTYRIVVWVRDTASSGAVTSTLGRFDASAGTAYRIR